MPHSVLSLSAQRPARADSPGATARVQGATHGLRAYGALRLDWVPGDQERWSFRLEGHATSGASQRSRLCSTKTDRSS